MLIENFENFFFYLCKILKIKILKDSFSWIIVSRTLTAQIKRILSLQYASPCKREHQIGAPLPTATLHARK